MPKKNAYSRNVAQRSKTKQKSFELVRPASDEDVLETARPGETSKAATSVEVVEEEEYEEEETEGGEEDDEEEEEKVVVKKEVPAAKTKATPTKVAVSATSVPSSNAPKSAAARLAERRKAEQKAKVQRASANLILAENYAYVRKDLVFILILAIIMFAAIITMHFVPAIGG